MSCIYKCSGSTLSEISQIAIQATFRHTLAWLHSVLESSVTAVLLLTLILFSLRVTTFDDLCPCILILNPCLQQFTKNQKNTCLVHVFFWFFVNFLWIDIDITHCILDSGEDKRILPLFTRQPQCVSHPESICSKSDIISLSLLAGLPIML